MAPAPASLYALLEVPQEASNEQVRQAFRHLSKRFHPDTTELALALGFSLVLGVGLAWWRGVDWLQEAPPLL